MEIERNAWKFDGSRQQCGHCLEQRWFDPFGDLLGLDLWFTFFIFILGVNVHICLLHVTKLVETETVFQLQLTLVFNVKSKDWRTQQVDLFTSGNSQDTQLLVRVPFDTFNMVTFFDLILTENLDVVNFTPSENFPDLNSTVIGTSG
ncbi:hypothetical protein WICPIJ_003953 [Wickerhamomyces pijperi]|uniref:Uncharacterized protein n=1 Tax=Wickerhamomyces pijperi TaxID=599730 RepID=A0A9P8Q6U7_WICPI|nr:hypothetical protein WICPIJ_003953 [Wickerhamomyces pijperi]